MTTRKPAPPRLPEKLPGPRAKRLEQAAAVQALRVLDSSCWLEFFADTERADLFAAPITAVEALVVPVVTVYEVVKKLAREAGAETATRAAALMQRGRVVPVDAGLALDAAVNGLPLAASLIYATARRAGAVLWTQDAHFDGLPGVQFFAKPSPPARR